ncbi:hypothetical protein P7K49_023086 [Saguinus oedipus]|uniref:Uncharacterized protein n=1 Tax=Saguinus oedipus TaxID=9490 RepID=A0ABQ9ULF4_SAGOE|nr:hypothetical protein P7K49_023086 [Saguinus oedipus]
MINIEGKMRPSESFLLEFLCNFFSTLLIVPIPSSQREGVKSGGQAQGLRIPLQDGGLLFCRQGRRHPSGGSLQRRLLELLHLTLDIKSLAQFIDAYKCGSKQSVPKMALSPLQTENFWSMLKCSALVSIVVSLLVD